MNPSGAENNLGEGALLHTIDATIEQMKASEAVAEQTRQELAALLAEKEEFISERDAELDQIERVSGENIRLKAEVATIKEQFKAKVCDSWFVVCSWKVVHTRARGTPG